MVRDLREQDDLVSRLEGELVDHRRRVYRVVAGIAAAVVAVYRSQRDGLVRGDGDAPMADRAGACRGRDRWFGE